MTKEKNDQASGGKPKTMPLQEIHLNEGHFIPSESYSDIPKLEELAEEEDQSAMVKLVELYSPAPTITSGQRDVNPTQAFKWVKKLEELGAWQGRHWLADCYFTGEHVEARDWDKAMALLIKYANEGDVFAWVRLAYYYSHGVGVGKDFIQAIEWLTQLVAYEDLTESSLRPRLLKPYQFCTEFSFSYEEPRYKLAELYFHGGNGIEQNLNKAVEWLKKAIKWPEKPYNENCRAQLKLGECYFQGGYGLEQDFTKAVEWFEKAADCYEQCIYHRIAQHKLGRCFFLGRGVNQNYNKAIDWFNQSLEKTVGEYRWGISAELVTAQAESGICHYRVGKSDEALKLFEESAAQNDAIANLWLAYLIQRENDKKEIKYVPRLERPGFSFIRKSNEDIQLSEEIDKRGEQIAEYLCKAAVRFVFQNDDDRYFDADMMDFIFPEEVIEFLNEMDEQNSSSPAKVILGFQYHCKKDDKLYLECLEQASKKSDILANYLLGKFYKEKESAYFDTAIGYFNKVDKEIKLEYSPFDEKKLTQREYPLNAQQFLVYSAKAELSNIKHQEEIEEKNKHLLESQKGLEDMMSMFAHKFRSPLDAIIYNTTHDNQVKLYTEAAQTMRGLLNIFSIISTDADILKDKIKQDRQGGSSLATVFSKTLDMILLHLLSVSGAEKIQQHYMAYAKAHGQCDAEVSYKTWCEDYFELEQALQAEWEQSFALLLNQSASLEQRLAWLEQHFFKLELIGFERAEFQFKEYGVTESFITILLNEILVNAFKYYSSASKQSVIVEWTVREGYQVLICRNPSIRSERTIIKGSHKGHAFLSALARKTGSTFTKPIPQDEFVVEFGIPNELLISK